MESKWTRSIPRGNPRHAQGVEVTLDQAYLNLIAAAEALRANQPGADKTWVAELVSSSARHFARATRLR